MIRKVDQKSPASGTFDVSILEIAGGVFRPPAAWWSQREGGRV